MKRSLFHLSMLAVAGVLLFGTLTALGQGGPRQKGPEKAEPTPLPSDPRLLKLHRTFVTEAENLAKEYEQKKQVDKCRVVCEEILKLVPGYPGAVDMLAKIQQKEATAERALFDIQANEGWQDTGIIVLQEKPITIAAQGKWTFHMEYELGPDGMDIPKEAREFKFGALIGFIETPPKDKENKVQPFHVGNGTQFMAKESGKLWMRMHDSDPSDNKGRMSVEVNGTFLRNAKK